MSFSYPYTRDRETGLTSAIPEITRLRRALREHRADMKARGIKKTSPFNGGMDIATYHANTRRFQLETELANAIKRNA